MTTIAETTGTAASAIDNIASAATALAEWSDADTDVDTSATDTTYLNNGRVLHHSPSGMYVLLFLHKFDYYTNNNDGRGGIRVVISSDWDTTASEPAGNTTRADYDNTQSGLSGGNAVEASFDAYSYDPNNNLQGNGGDFGAGAYYIANNDNEPSWADVRGTDITYVSAVTSDHLYLAVWNEVDGTYGSAGYLHWEYVDNKFWDDSHDPWVMTSKMNWTGTNDYYNPEYSMYGWTHWMAKPRQAPDSNFAVGGFQTDDWGSINPDSNDDTFFFRRPVIFQNHGNNTPTAYVEDMVPNDSQSGGSHGDVVNAGTVPYRCWKQSGAAGAETLSAAFRHE